MMIRALLRKPLAWALGAAIVMLGVLWLLGQLTSGQRAKTEAKLGRNTTEAALESGRDAVGSVAAEAALERATDDLTTENADAIRNAEGADAPVAAPARDAGLTALCRRAAYRDSPRCVRERAADRRGE